MVTIDGVASSLSAITLFLHHCGEKYIDLHLKFTIIMALFKHMHPYMLCYLLFSSAVIWAEHPPKFVYRADLRLPSDVFYDGFPVLGTNDNLHEHVSGSSCGNDQSPGNTAFIDTTASRKVAIEWGQILLKNSRHAKQFYLYKIRATDDFYDCRQSLLETYRKLGRNEDKLLGQYLSDFSRLQPQVERWLAYGNILPEQVKSATAITGKEESKMPIANPRFKGASTKGNPGAYIYDPKSQEKIRTFGVEHTACFPSDWYILETPHPWLWHQEQVPVKPSTAVTEPPAKQQPLPQLSAKMPPGAMQPLKSPGAVKSHEVEVQGAKKQNAEKSVVRLMRTLKNISACILKTLLTLALI